MDELCRLPCLTRTILGSSSVVFGSTAATFSRSETISGGAVKTKLILVVPVLMSSNTLDILAACTFWLFKYEKAAIIEVKTIKPNRIPWPVIIHSRGSGKVGISEERIAVNLKNQLDAIVKTSCIFSCRN